MHTLKQIQKELGFLRDTTIRNWMDRGMVPIGTKIGIQRIFSDEEFASIRAYHATRKPWQRYDKATKKGTN
jgi:hypothetical protein